MSRDARSLLKLAREQGYDVVVHGSHRDVYRDGARVAGISVSPGDRRGVRNLEAALRRAGVRLPWRGAGR